MERGVDAVGTTDIMKKQFIRMFRVGRTTQDILNDINYAEERGTLNPKTIPETLRILEEARREYRGTI